MQDQFEHCAAMVRQADHDRYLATLFAPADKRDALFALYAFNVEVSRVRDLAREPMPGEIRLQWWREVLRGEREGEATAHPIAAALLWTLSRYNLASDKLVDLVEAHRFDVYNEPMARLSALQSYALRTAATIFEFAVDILSSDPTSVSFTGDAGQAQTIADVLAFLPRHVTRHQLYVPQEVLRLYGAEPEELFAMRATPGVRAALAEFRLRARRHLAQVGTGANEIPIDARPAFLSLAPLRRWLLDMERPDYDPFRPAQVAPWRRQWRIWRAANSFARIGG